VAPSSTLRRGDAEARINLMELWPMEFMVVPDASWRVDDGISIADAAERL